jgi:SAM-dependent methyltransferase
MTQTVNPNWVQSSQQLYLQADHIAPVPTTSPSPFRHLTFPWSVYAHALLLEEGKAAYLHYGLFQNDKTSLQAAQQFSTDLLMARLPPPPCRILEVGIGPGTTFSLLNRQGYDVHGITPDAQQIAYIQKSLGTGASVTCQSLEDFQARSESFGVVLFQESAQYIEPLVIFNKALDLLPASGDLFIIDEFALKHDEAGTGGLHLLKDMVTLAGRLGFELVEHVDLSTLSAPTLDYLLRVTTIHRQSLIKDLALSDEQLTQLDESNRTYHKKYASGHYGYALLHFKKKITPRWRLRVLEENQVPEMFSLFKKTFHHSMTPATWQWKYGSNSGRGIGVWQENRLIAHYGGIQRDILLFGQQQAAVQIVDVMVDAAERGVLTRKGAFFLMAATFPERFVGYGKPYLLGFGFPNERHMKVAKRHGLYAKVGHLVEFSWNALSRFPLWGTRLQPINREQIDFATAAAINECWQRMAADLKKAIIGVRNWQYLQHRYLDHPSQQYQIILVKNRFSGRARGILVLRYDSEDCEIIDLIAPLEEIPLLIIHARRLAGIGNKNRVFCHITENFAAHFAAADGTRQTLDIHIPATTWSVGPTPEILKDQWWLMSGDKDHR